MPPLALIPNRPAGESDILSYGYGGSGSSYASPYTASYEAQIRDAENKAREQKRQADREYTQKQQELDDKVKIAKINARTANERNDIDEWYQQQQVKLAQDRLAQEARIDELTRAENARQFNERLAFDRDVQAQNLGLKQADLGYSLLNMQANLRGPENYYQAAELARGVAAQPGTATFLNALRGNTNLVGFGAQAGVPDRASVNALSAKLGGSSLIPGTGGGGGGVTNDDANLGAIRSLYAAGAHKLGAGSLEQLTATELGLLKSGIDASGGDWNTFMDQYRRSRIGQGFGGGYRAA